MKINKPFLLPSGIKLRRHSLKEGYSIEAGPDDRKMVMVNISADHMAEALAVLFDALEYPGFLIIETPARVEQSVKGIPLLGAEPGKMNVYYWDGLNKESAQSIFQQNKDLLVNDGISNFGFGSHINKEEVYAGRYKTIYIWTKSPEKFRFLLEGQGINKCDGTPTLGDFINRRNPCDLCSLKVDGRNIYQLIEELLPKGLYLAKTVEG